MATLAIEAVPEVVEGAEAKKWNTTYATQSGGTCKTNLRSSDECFTAVTSLGQKPSIMSTVASSSLPSGCSIVAYRNGTLEALFNNLSNPTTCGVSQKLVGIFSSLVNISVDLDATVAGGLVTITLTGPANAWFGVGFNALSMADQPYAIIVDGLGNVTERKIGNHNEGIQLTPTQVKLVSNSVSGNARTVVLVRAFKGATQNHFTFSTSSTSIPFINAVGSTPALAFHKAYAAATLVLEAIDAPICVCNEGNHGTINGIPFPPNRCASEPIGDLLQQKNPTCAVETYGLPYIGI